MESLLLCTAVVLLLLFLPLTPEFSLTARPTCYGQFTAELTGRELVVGCTCKSSCSGAADTSTVPCNIVSGTVSALVELKTCVQTSSYDGDGGSDSGGEVSGVSATAIVFSTSDTLLTHLSPHENCTTTTGCQWTFELAQRFLEAPCLDVHVADFTTSVPSLRGIRKRLWNSLQDSDAGFAELPQCLQTTDLLQWAMVQSGICSGNHRSFTPSHQYTASSTEVFVTSNNAILYRGCAWYQLLMPLSTNMISFTHISNTFYAVLTNNQNGEVGVWVGVTGVSPLLQVYPSPALDWIWGRDAATLNSVMISASALAVDHQGNLIAVSGDEELQLPISLLLSHSFYHHHLSLTPSNQSTFFLSLQLSASEDGLSLEDRPHPLLHHTQTSLVCPLSSVVVEAPICSRVTRSVVEIEGAGALQFVDNDTLPWLNCGVKSRALPSDVFLRLGESYVFTVHLMINPLLAAEIDVNELGVVATLSMPDTIEIVTEGAFHTTNNTITHQVIFKEKSVNDSQTQVPPATILHSVDVHLQVRGVGMECVDPLNSRPELLGRMETKVHVGCPPGLSLVFDHRATQARDSQFCTPANNISCYYFGNEFHPVMELVDSVTGERSTYTGPYTLTVLAGGTSKSNMKNFNSNIQSQIWTVSEDDILNHDNNEIEWTCGLGSPCGEVLPGIGQSPEYYLHLQASNRVVGQGETYCDLTVEFTIRLHGLSMGPITTFVTLILLLVLLVVPLLSLFLVWLWRERQAEAGSFEAGSRLIEWYKTEVASRVKELVARLWARAEELSRNFRQPQPLEPHLHTD